MIIYMSVVYANVYSFEHECAAGVERGFVTFATKTSPRKATTTFVTM